MLNYKIVNLSLWIKTLESFNEVHFAVLLYYCT